MDYNMYMGINIFHVKESPVNYVDFSSTILNSTYLKINTINNIAGKFMRF